MGDIIDAERAEAERTGEMLLKRAQKLNIGQSVNDYKNETTVKKPKILSKIMEARKKGKKKTKAKRCKCK
jgi:hypothetical protein